jgi:nitroimidazol reductase NimA-like FMN-containing flavoprotein (pyridoxamine 5'-phosphate oxidase superfamily)
VRDVLVLVGGHFASGIGERLFISPEAAASPAEEVPMVTTHPQFSELTVDAARALLTRQHVGRLAFSMHDHVDIEPLNYASDGEWIFGRTSMGTKLATLLHHPFCAFEADEVRDIFDWSSVVVKGTFYLLDPETGSTDSYRRALRLLREAVPGSFSAEDPVPQRDILFGIFVHDLTGRAATP